MNEAPGNLRVLTLLRRGGWFTAAEIERECEVTCHSRISDLRNLHHHEIERKRNPGGTGRGKYMYRLVADADQVFGVRAALAELEATVPPPSGSASVGSQMSSGPEGPGGNAGQGGGTDGEASPSWPANIDETLPPPRRTVEEVVSLLSSHGLVECGAELGDRLFDFEGLAA